MLFRSPKPQTPNPKPQTPNPISALVSTSMAHIATVNKHVTQPGEAAITLRQAALSVVLSRRRSGHTAAVDRPGDARLRSMLLDKSQLDGQSNRKKRDFGDSRPLVKDVWMHYKTEQVELQPKDDRERLNTILERTPKINLSIRPGILGFTDIKNIQKKGESNKEEIFKSMPCFINPIESDKSLVSILRNQWTDTEMFQIKGGRFYRNKTNMDIQLDQRKQPKPLKSTTKSHIKQIDTFNSTIRASKDSKRKQLVHIFSHHDSTHHRKASIKYQSDDDARMPDHRRNMSVFDAARVKQRLADDVSEMADKKFKLRSNLVQKDVVSDIEKEVITRLDSFSPDWSKTRDHASRLVELPSECQIDVSAEESYRSLIDSKKKAVAESSLRSLSNINIKNFKINYQIVLRKDIPSKNVSKERLMINKEFRHIPTHSLSNEKSSMMSSSLKLVHKSKQINVQQPATYNNLIKTSKKNNCKARLFFSQAMTLCSPRQLPSSYQLK